MNEIHDLGTAMLAVAIAAVMLVAGGLYIDRPIQSPSGPAQMALSPSGPARMTVVDAQP